jgi:putative protein-disulfide isomerase
MPAMESPAINEALLKEIGFTLKLEVKGFPSLLLEKEGVFTAIQHEYSDVMPVLLQVKRHSQ